MGGSDELEGMELDELGVLDADGAVYSGGFSAGELLELDGVEEGVELGIMPLEVTIELAILGVV